jgi:AraC-like DNA-binding protein
MDSAWFGRILTPDNNVVPTCANVEKRVVTLFQDILNTFSRGISKTGVMYASQALRHLLAVTFFDNPSFTAGNNSKHPQQFRKTIDFMHQHLAEGFTLSQLARHAGLSPSRFSFLFKRLTGFPPVEYYIRIRIQEACRLLDTTALSVKEIAEQLGFDDPYYFSRSFKKIVGLAPRNYREKVKG